MSDAPPVVLTVAGSDPSGGAGVQADLKTIHQHGGYGTAVPTLITVQNTCGVEEVELLSPDLVRAQLATLLADLEPAAAKTGALGSPAVAHVLGSLMDETDFPWVVDPVWLPTRGRPLSRGDVVQAYKDAVIPRAALVTPNAQEAALLAEMPVRSLEDAREAAERIAALGANAVLVKGGHLEGSARGTDLLLHEGTAMELVAVDVVPGHFHGTGCALSAAIATRMAFGQDIPAAVKGAKGWLTGALTHAFAVGRGAKPVNHSWPLEDKP
ncbi:MAG: bifunctional hydroxymethylpyrimidine kinase/phosphomethylpyrimidine kinase [Deltaproteobacteria bacterium]|nr:bifunctional hydroxymethylpyrimidine kinase/phosphomethylpyrimidine kinase [Deltaproteobacteria bacterium]MBW1876186.1 bifunctional hydroxymethylpyrimidine kinase/phosphomethylpyrimidine kinase [Deltaproteobacteria bacterium]MBW2214597.1 bifunctional hydroxymethylpyrimidine kinase/phosphomethylpyrimidine kinase [Deltaproteobacteria bacterium]MBW2551186.1 bifunctional hydroxymethylpyrimidine kinase/phosphomethylpyrimidine kinase [Deltaproteobacteria bacterium]